MSADKRSQSGGREEAFGAAPYVSRQKVEPQVVVTVVPRKSCDERLLSAVDTSWFHTEKFSFSTIVSLK